MMAIGDGIRRNVARISQEERYRLIYAFLALDTNKQYPDGVTFWDKQEDIHKNAHAAGQDVQAAPHSCHGIASSATGWRPCCGKWIPAFRSTIGIGQPTLAARRAGKLSYSTTSSWAARTGMRDSRFKTLSRPREPPIPRYGAA